MIVVNPDIIQFPHPGKTSIGGKPLILIFELVPLIDRCFIGRPNSARTQISLHPSIAKSVSKFEIARTHIADKGAEKVVEWFRSLIRRQRVKMFHDVVTYTLDRITKLTYRQHRRFNRSIVIQISPLHSYPIANRGPASRVFRGE